MSSWPLDNPVITKELRGRMRGARTYWLLFGYLLLLSLILFFSYLGWWNSHSGSMQSSGSAGFTVGRTFFKILLYSQAVMIALITPALTAGAISVEREQRTFEMLRGTILPPRAIVWGKLVSSVSFVALLLTSSLPLVSLCFLLGGVSPGEVFFAFLLLLGDAFLFGAIGLCWSAFAASTATATVLSYATLILFFVVTFPFAIPAFDPSGFTPNFGFSAVNPVGAVTGAVLPEHYYGWTLPAWVPALLLNGTLSVLLVLASINRLEDFPVQRAGILRGTVLLFGGLIVFFADGVVLGATGRFGLPIYMQTLLITAISTALLLLFVPVLVTGDLEGWKPERAKSAFLQFLSPRRLFAEAALPSGLPLALLLTAVVVGLSLAAPHLGSLSALPITRATGSLPPGRFGAVVTAVTEAQITGILEQAAAMTVLIVFGLSGLGFLLSVLLGNRWTALTLLYLTLVLAVAMPFFSYGMLQGTDAQIAARSPAVNSLYLCPLLPLIQLSDSIHPGYLGVGHGDVATGMIGFKSGPLWIGTGLVYLSIGLVSYAAALAFLRRRVESLN